MFLIVVLMAVLSFASCAAPPVQTCPAPYAQGSVSLKVVSWNVQTFFDARTEGCEYAEFKKGGWGKDAYVCRLKNLILLARSLPRFKKKYRAEGEGMSNAGPGNGSIHFPGCAAGLWLQKKHREIIIYV